MKFNMYLIVIFERHEIKHTITSTTTKKTKNSSKFYIFPPLFFLIKKNEVFFIFNKN